MGHRGAEGSPFLSSSSSPSPCRVAMCVGKCSRIVGPCLLALGTLSVAANILLLFPGGASKYLAEGHISKHAKAMPGVWGGGITVSTAVCTASFLAGLRSRDKGMERAPPLRPPAAFSFPQVLLAATHITAVGWRCAGCSDCGTRRNVRQRRDPRAKALPSSARWDVAGGPRVGWGRVPPLPWPCGGTWHGSSSPMAPRWDVVGGPSPVAGCGRVLPLPCWVMAGCHLARGPMVGRGMDLPLPWPHGGMWQGAPSPTVGRGGVPPLPWRDAAWCHLPRGPGFPCMLAWALPH